LELTAACNTQQTFQNLRAKHKTKTMISALLSLFGKRAVRFSGTEDRIEHEELEDLWNPGMKFVPGAAQKQPVMLHIVSMLCPWVPFSKTSVPILSENEAHCLQVEDVAPKLLSERISWLALRVTVWRADNELRVAVTFQWRPEQWSTDIALALSNVPGLHLFDDTVPPAMWQSYDELCYNQVHHRGHKMLRMNFSEQEADAGLTKLRTILHFMAFDLQPAKDNLLSILNPATRYQSNPGTCSDPEEYKINVIGRYRLLAKMESVVSILRNVRDVRLSLLEEVYSPDGGIMFMAAQSSWNAHVMECE